MQGRLMLGGVFLVVVSCCPTYNVGLPTMAIPFNSGVTAYAYGRGDSCADSTGVPPFIGLYGNCGGWVTDRQIIATGNPELEDQYQGEHLTTIDGPSYFAGADSRATGKGAAAGNHPTAAVRTIGIAGSRTAERPTGWLIVLGVVAPLLMLAGLVMFFGAGRLYR